MFDGSTGTDEYLDAWEWGAYYEVDGSAEDVVSAEAERINKGMPDDFVQLATDKMASINAAYDRVCEQRGIR